MSGLTGMSLGPVGTHMRVNNPARVTSVQGLKGDPQGPLGNLMGNAGAEVQNDGEKEKHFLFIKKKFPIFF